MSGQVCEYRSFCEIRTNFVGICANLVQFVYRLRSVSPMVLASTLPLPQVVPHTLCLVCRCPSTEVRHHGRKRFTPHHRVHVTGEESEQGKGSGAGRAPSEARSERSEGSARSGRNAGGRSEASSGAGRGQGAVRQVVIPMPSREDLGTAHLDPPPAQVTLAARQPEAAWQQRVAPGPDGRQWHLLAVWELAVEAQGVRANLCIPFPCPLVIRGGSNLPTGHELVGMFAYRLVSGHWRVQTGVAGIGEGGTVTTAGIIALAAVTGWDKRRAEWFDVAWLAMRVHVGRMQSGEGGGGGDVIDVKGEDAPPTPRAGSEKPPTPADTGPPASKAPRTSTPAERAARERTRGDVAEWVEQQ